MADFNITIGDDRDIQITVTDDGTSSGTAVDVSSATILWTAWRQGTESPTISKGAADAEVTVSGASSNIITLSLTDTITAALTEGATYNNHVQVTISGATETIDKFTFKALEDAPT